MLKLIINMVDVELIIWRSLKMLLTHPILVLRHMAETMLRKRRNARAG